MADTILYTFLDEVAVAQDDSAIVPGPVQIVGDPEVYEDTGA